MVLSMTGYGSAQVNRNGLTLNAELRSLNSRYLEFNFRLPPQYARYEGAIKNLLTPLLVRGKVTLILAAQNNDPELNRSQSPLNLEVLRSHYQNLSTLKDELGLQQEIQLSALLQLPQVVNADLAAQADEDEWELLQDCLRMAAKAITQSRRTEGEALADDLRVHLGLIEGFLEQVPQHDSTRIDHLRTRLLTALQELKPPIQLAEDRFQQEMLYYLEKWDISEEMVRARAHLVNFRAQLDAPESQGRKLLFLVQEIWREVNTMGNKANEINIQTLAVNIKDELEKLKEQLMNIL